MTAELPASLPDDGRPVHRTTTRVRYAETDTMQVAHHSIYVVWMEMARIEFLRAHGISYRAMEEDGTILPVAEVRLRMQRPARYDDLVGIDCWILEARSRRLALGYRLSVLEDGHTGERREDTMAFGSTQLVCASADMRSKRFDDGLLARLQALAGD